MYFLQYLHQRVCFFSGCFLQFSDLCSYFPQKTRSIKSGFCCILLVCGEEKWPLQRRVKNSRSRTLTRLTRETGKVRCCRRHIEEKVLDQAFCGTTPNYYSMNAVGWLLYFLSFTFITVLGVLSSVFSASSKFLKVVLQIWNVKEVSFCVITRVNVLYSFGKLFRMIAISSPSLTVFLKFLKKGCCVLSSYDIVRYIFIQVFLQRSQFNI